MSQCSHPVKCKNSLFQTTHFSVSTQFSSIWPIDKTLSGALTTGQSGPGSNDNEGILCIPLSSSITEVLPSDYLVSYTGHSLIESYPSSEAMSVNFTTPADREKWFQVLLLILWSNQLWYYLTLTLCE